MARSKSESSTQARINCTISNQYKAEFDYVQEQLTISNQGEVIGTLLSGYRELQILKKQMSTSEITLSQEEKDLVDKAVANSGMSREEIAKRGLLAEARTAISLARRQAELSEADPEALKKMTFKGVAATRIETVIKRIMEHNDSQGEQKNRFFISENLVAKLTGSNRGAIRDYFDSHKLWIEDHNHKYGLEDTNNRKGKGYDFKQMLGL